MFLKVKIVMTEFSNPGIILMPQIHAGKVRNVSKILANLVSNSPVCVSPMTDSTAWGAPGRRAGSARQRQNQEELSTKKIRSGSKQATCTTWANCKNRLFLNCSCYVLKQTLLGELICRTPLLTQTHRVPFNRGIPSAVSKWNLLHFQIFLSLL